LDHTEPNPPANSLQTQRGFPRRAPELIELSDGDRLDRRIDPVAKRLGAATLRMLAYNGSIPGPTMKVQNGSGVIVNVENQGDVRRAVTRCASTGTSSAAPVAEATQR
jgi:hypothetical protein